MIYKHISSLFLSFCLLACSLTAQENVSEEAFDKAVDYVNCKFAEYSVGKENKNSDFKQKCDCEKKPDFKSISNAIPGSLEVTLNLIKEVDNFKKEFKPNLDKQSALNLIMKNMFNDDKYQKIKKFYSSKKGEEAFTALIKDIQPRVEQIINGKKIESSPEAEQTHTIDPNTVDMMKEPPVPPVSEEAEVGAWLPYVLVFLCSLIVSALLFYSIGIPMIQKKTQAQIEHERNERSLGFSGAANKIESLEARYNQLHNEYQALKRDMKDAQRNDSRNTQSTSQSYTPPTHVEVELYFPSPNAEGSFNASHGSVTFRDSASIYKFTITGTNRARFRIDDRSNAIVRALRSQSNVNPVCISENIWDDKYTKITTLKEGIAELEGDRWVVRSNDKARIRYEA